MLANFSGLARETVRESRDMARGGQKQMGVFGQEKLRKYM